MRYLIHTLRTRYKQFGGLRLIRVYWKMGLMGKIVKGVLRNPFSKETYKRVYYNIVRDVEPVLISKYGPMMPLLKAHYSSMTLEHRHDKIIWFCWLQGLDVAPKIVKVCHASLLKHLPEYEIKLIDNENWRQYVDLPYYIVEKWNKGMIPPANFSDLIRLQLLIKYGGTWIDATVLCSGLTEVNSAESLSFLQADLFMFQYTKPGSDVWGGISNWFISAYSNNEVLMVLRDMLFEYWKDYDVTLDYYIFHLFFTMLRDVYPHEIASMPYGYSVRSIALVHHWGEPFNADKWARFTNKVCFHKLAYNIKPSVLKDHGNYYWHLVGGELSI